MMLDIIGIALIVLFFVRGYMKGIIVAAFSILAIILGIVCSLKLSERFATFLADQHIITSGWCQLVSYLAIFIGIVLIVRLIAKAIESSLEMAMLGWVNRGIGGLLYAFMISVVWSTFLWIGTKMHIFNETTIMSSKTYPYLSQLTPWLFQRIGKFWPMVTGIFHDLELFFGKVNTHVGTAR